MTPAEDAEGDAMAALLAIALSTKDHGFQVDGRCFIAATLDIPDEYRLMDFRPAGLAAY